MFASWAGSQGRAQRSAPIHLNMQRQAKKCQPRKVGLCGIGGGRSTSYELNEPAQATGSGGCQPQTRR